MIQKEQASSDEAAEAVDSISRSTTSLKHGIHCMGPISKSYSRLGHAIKCSAGVGKSVEGVTRGLDVPGVDSLLAMIVRDASKLWNSLGHFHELSFHGIS